MPVHAPSILLLMPMDPCPLETGHRTQVEGHKMIRTIKLGRRRWPGLLWAVVAVVSLSAAAVQLAWSQTTAAAASMPDVD